jgi:hypothetical protein
MAFSRGLGIGDWGLGCGVWGVGFGDCGLRTADCGLRTADCGLRTADCGRRRAWKLERAWREASWDRHAPAWPLAHMRARWATAARLVPGAPRSVPRVVTIALHWDWALARCSVRSDRSVRSVGSLRSPQRSPHPTPHTPHPTPQAPNPKPQTPNPTSHTPGDFPAEIAYNSSERGMSFPCGMGLSRKTGGITRFWEERCNG